jgi:hypothetical protein
MNPIQQAVADGRPIFGVWAAAPSQRHGKLPGGVAMSPQNAELLLEHGMRLLTVGSDAGYIARGIAEDVKRTKEWIAAHTK